MDQEETVVALTNTLGLNDTLVELEQACAVTIPDAVESLDGDPDALARLYHHLARLKKHLADAMVEVEDALIDSMPTQEMIIPGIGEISYSKGAARKEWDNDAVWREVERLVAENVTVWHDFETGDTLDSNDPTQRQQIVASVRSGITEYLGAPSWKVGTKSRGQFVGGLRGAGVEIDEYCTTSWGRKKIKFPTEDDLQPKGEG